jgi:hypothetical protein
MLITDSMASAHLSAATKLLAWARQFCILVDPLLRCDELYLPALCGGIRAGIFPPVYFPVLFVTGESFVGKLAPRFPRGDDKAAIDKDCELPPVDADGRKIAFAVGFGEFG